MAAKDTKKLSLTPAGSVTEKPDKKAVRAIERSVEYSYLLRINKRDMLDYQNLCKHLGESVPKNLHRFIRSELIKHGEREPGDEL